MNRIHCAISESLRDVFESHELPNGVSKIFIKSNDEYQLEGYNILVLDRQNEDMYSGIEFRSERHFDVVAYYNRKINRPEDLDKVIKTLIQIRDEPGIIAFQQIKILMNLGILIYDGDISRIQGASYDLVIDKEFLRSGVAVEEREIIEIPPFDFVVVCARESANIPRNICATFDLKVSMFCKGIILSNGPQVDPGYQGRLLCLLFNSSSVPFRMEPHADFEFATLQFQSLSISSDVPYSGRYRKKQSVRDYVAQYAQETISDRMVTISKMQKTILELQSTTEEIKININDIINKNANYEKDISELKGSTVKWISLIAALLAFVGVLYGTYRLENLSYNLGKIEEKTSYISTRVKENSKTIKQINEKIRSEGHLSKKGKKSIN